MIRKVVAQQYRAMYLLIWYDTDWLIRNYLGTLNYSEFPIHFVINYHLLIVRLL